MKSRAILRILFVGTLLFFVYPVFSQTTSFSLQGVVIDTTNRAPLDGASVVLLSAKDSMYVTMVMSDTKGAFLFPKVSGGNYLLAITYLGYKNLMKPIMLSGAPRAVMAGTFAMPRSMFDLQEVEVTTVYNPIIIKQDTVEYVASAFKIDEGDMVEDLVKKLPGVEVDMDGNITANGKSINRVYVNGRQFFGSDPKLATRNLPANIVDRIQIIERKSEQAQFTGIEDMDTETVMNITLRSDRQNIWMGLMRAGLGTDKQYDSGFTLQRWDSGNQFMWTNSFGRLAGGSGNFTNFQSDSFSGNRSRGQGQSSGGQRGGFSGGFGGGGQGGGSGLNTSWNSSLNINRDVNPNLQVGVNYSFSGSRSESENGSRRQELLSALITRPDGSKYLLDSTNIQNSTSTRVAKTFNHQLGMEVQWTIDSLRSIIFQPSISYGGNTSEQTQNMQKESQNSHILLNDQQSISTSDRTSFSMSGDLTFRQRFTKKGRTFSVALTGDYGSDATNAYSWSETMSKRRLRISGVDTLRTTFISVDRIRTTDAEDFSYRSRLNYTEPLFTGHTLQLSYTLSDRVSSSDAGSWNKDELTDAYDIIDTVRTDYSSNNNLSQSYRIDFQGRLTKVQYTLGFSRQDDVQKTNSSLRGEIRQTKSTLAPSFDFRYMVNANTNLRFSFSGRTTPPSLDQLKPVNTSDDPLRERIGNEDLKTSFSGTYTLSFDTYNREKMKTLRLSSSYSSTKNSIVNRTYYDDGGKQITEPVNVNGNWNGSFNLTFNTPLKGTNFTINTNSSSSYRNQINYTRIAQTTVATDYQKGATEQLSLSENLNIRYMNVKKTIEATAIGRVNYDKTWYSVNSNNNIENWRFVMTGSTSVNLPKSITLKSDFNYSIRKGRSVAGDMNSATWNAQITKLIFKRRQGAIIIKINDILKDQDIYSYSASETYITESWSNKITQYFLAIFQYRFTVAAKSKSNSVATGGGRNGSGQRTGGQRTGTNSGLGTSGSRSGGGSGSGARGGGGGGGGGGGRGGF